MHEPISKRLVYKDELKAVYRVEYPIIEIDEYHNLLVIDTETKSCAFPLDSKEICIHRDSNTVEVSIVERIAPLMY